MANTLKDIRKRIGSVKNTQKITKAMKMVAAAKLRRSQQALMAARPYADHLAMLVAQVAAAESDHPQHPLLVPREEAKVARLLVLTSDRGFCGGFNGNLLRRVLDWRAEQGARYERLELHVIGKKGRDFFKARGIELASVEIGAYQDFNLGKARERASALIEGYFEGQFDEGWVVFNGFRSAMSQNITFRPLLPVLPGPRSEATSAQRAREGGGSAGFAGGGGDASPYDNYLPDYIYEPAAPRLLAELLPRFVTTMLFRIFLESIASEFGARMVAMDNATSNCSEMIDKLTLTGNRLRQAAITNELMDIVNGAEAL